MAGGEVPQGAGGEGAGVVAHAEQAAKVAAEDGAVGEGGEGELRGGEVDADGPAYGVLGGGGGGGGAAGEVPVHLREEAGAQDGRVGEDGGGDAVEGEGGRQAVRVRVGGDELAEGDGQRAGEGGAVVEGVEGGVHAQLRAVRGQGADEVRRVEHVVEPGALAPLLLAAAAAQVDEVGGVAGEHAREDELCWRVGASPLAREQQQQEEEEEEQEGNSPPTSMANLMQLSSPFLTAPGPPEEGSHDTMTALSSGNQVRLAQRAASPVPSRATPPPRKSATNSFFSSWKERRTSAYCSSTCSRTWATEGPSRRYGPARTTRSTRPAASLISRRRREGASSILAGGGGRGEEKGRRRKMRCFEGG